MRRSAISVGRPYYYLAFTKPVDKLFLKDAFGLFKGVLLFFYWAQGLVLSSMNLSLPTGWLCGANSLCDMLENATEELELTDGKLKSNFRAFEIKIVRVML